MLNNRKHPSKSDHFLRFLQHNRKKCNLVVQNREIGVDVEYIRSNFVCDKIAERFFYESGKSILRSLTAGSKIEAFFNCWTRKEKYGKE